MSRLRLHPLAAVFAVLMAMVLGSCEKTEEAAPEPVAEQGGATKAPVPAAGPRSLKQGKVVSGDALQVPFILWGGDMASFYGNGGLKTTEGSIFHEQGLVVELTPGDDFDKQLAAYKSGASPFLRGTYRMIGLASADLAGEGDGARPLIFMQMTWSAGDHMVAREDIKTIPDLKGKTIAVQKGGPHVGMLDDVLATANLSWKDVNVTWADHITGPGSAAEMFRSDPGIDAAFAITPDMLGLSGGLENTGSGAEGTVKGARVLVSTAELSRSIADVYAVRKDFWEKDPKTVTNLAVAYLKSVEKVIDLKRDYEAKGSEPYMDLLQMSQNIWGAEAIPTLEDDAHGLLSDCTFVGYPGNVSFFLDDKNRHGFADFASRSQSLASHLGKKGRVDVATSPIPWESAEVKSRLSKTDAARGDRFDGEAVLSEVETMDADGVLDSRTLLSFTIAFQPNQTEFDARKYAKEYERVFELADRYGNAAVVIRGHSDTTLVLRDAVKAGLENGKLKRSGTSGNYQYFLDGRPLDISDADAMIKAIQTSDAFRPAGGFDPRKTMQAALNLSRERAASVRKSLIDYAGQKGVRLDESQLQAQGVGIREPLVARPRSPEEAANNMRVEFRLVRVSAEAIAESDFDF